MKKELDKLFTEIIEDMHYSLKEYGNYTFWDKGPQEVMDIDKWVSEMKDLSANKAKEFLEKVYDYSKEGSKVANCIISDLEDMPDDWWDELMSGEKLEY